MRQSIQVELRRHAVRIVIGQLQRLRIFLAVNPNEQMTASAKRTGDSCEEAPRLFGFKISNARAWEKSHAVHAIGLWR